MIVKTILQEQLSDIVLIVHAMIKIWYSENVTSFIRVGNRGMSAPSELLSFIVKVTQPDDIDTRIIFIVDTRIMYISYNICDYIP